MWRICALRSSPVAFAARPFADLGVRPRLVGGLLERLRRDRVHRFERRLVPVAGLGTRVLPATKAMPKEMLTIVDKPLIQYVVDEAKEAGIEHFVFVTGRNKGVIEDHFDRMFELDTTLAARPVARTTSAMAGKRDCVFG